MPTRKATRNAGTATSDGLPVRQIPVLPAVPQERETQTHVHAATPLETCWRPTITFIETFINNEAMKHAKAITTPLVEHAFEMPPVTLERPTKYCHICGGGHWTSLCPYAKQHELIPTASAPMPTPITEGMKYYVKRCQICGGRHPTADCPFKPRPIVPLPGERRALSCRLCGERFWFAAEMQATAEAAGEPKISTLSRVNTCRHKDCPNYHGNPPHAEEQTAPAAPACTFCGSDPWGDDCRRHPTRLYTPWKPSALARQTPCCNFCDGNHWGIECPRNNRYHETVARRPTRPLPKCRLCPGTHWHRDCPNRAGPVAAARPA